MNNINSNNKSEIAKYLKYGESVDTLYPPGSHGLYFAYYYHDRSFVAVFDKARKGYISPDPMQNTLKR
jgi:hypothetical protein